MRSYTKNADVMPIKPAHIHNQKLTKHDWNCVIQQKNHSKAAAGKSLWSQFAYANISLQ